MLGMPRLFLLFFRSQNYIHWRYTNNKSEETANYWSTEEYYSFSVPLPSY